MATQKKKAPVASQAKNLRVVWDVSPEFPTSYATHFLVQHTKDDFTVTFFDIRPPVVMGAPKDKDRQFAELEQVTAVPQARIVIPPSRMREFVQVAQDNLKTYSETIGKEGDDK